MAYASNSLPMAAITVLVILMPLVPATARAGDPAPIAPLMPHADVAAGARLAQNKCSACHTFNKGGINQFGPNLWNAANSRQAYIHDYHYSVAFRRMHDTQWTDEALNRFLYNPQAYAPGTKMTFPGLKDAGQRAAVIAWLHTLSDKPHK
ncbi:MAG: c-type cytochrome [Pseudomonadota bacterium]|nr:c-type cytochrome [Pseudomonadota bacterium]